MNTKLDLSLLIGVHQIFHHRCDVESIIITKYVDDLLLVTRNEEWVDRAIGGIEQSFEIWGIVKSRRILNVNSIEVEQGADVLVVQIKQYQSTEIELFNLVALRRR